MTRNQEAALHIWEELEASHEQALAQGLLVDPNSPSDWGGCWYEGDYDEEYDTDEDFTDLCICRAAEEAICYGQDIPIVDVLEAAGACEVRFDAVELYGRLIGLDVAGRRRPYGEIDVEDIRMSDIYPEDFREFSRASRFHPAGPHYLRIVEAVYRLTAGTPSPTLADIWPSR